MKPPRPRAPSLTDSLKDMPSENLTDAAVRKAFSEPTPPELVEWDVRGTGASREIVKAHRMILSECGALSFMTDNQIWLILAPTVWSRVDRVDSMPTP